MLALSLEDAFREKAKEKQQYIGNMDLMGELSKNDLTNLSKRFLEVDTKKEVNTRAEVAKLTDTREKPVFSIITQANGKRIGRKE